MLHLVSSHKPGRSTRLVATPHSPVERAAPNAGLPLLVRGLLLLAVVYVALWLATH